MRLIAKDLLRRVLNKEQNINVIEKNIYEICGGDDEEDEELYKKILYQVLHDINQGIKLPDILKDLKKHKILWKHSSLDKYIKEEDEQDEFITNPFQVEEGIVECRCGSKRVYSYSKQTRSGDEGITSFHQCLKCKSKWSLNT
jgi:DNA-directed RNA polymerase subunit M/transcription elongation factor TFIIS